MKRLTRFALGTLGLLVVIELALILVFRRGEPRAMKWIARWNRRYLNPLMLQLAGRRNWYASSVHHLGRTSGRPHETPVWAHPVTGGFVVPLPYGIDADWVLNLQAAGGGSMIHHGEVYRLTNPAIVDRATALAELGPRERARYRVYAVDHFLQVDAARSGVSPLRETG